MDWKTCNLYYPGPNKAYSLNKLYDIQEGIWLYFHDPDLRNNIK